MKKWLKSFLVVVVVVFWGVGWVFVVAVVVGFFVCLFLFCFVLFLFFLLFF